MLKKLLKYEWKATARYFLPVYGLLFAMAAASRISWLFSEIDSVWNRVVEVTLLMGYIFLFAGVFVATFIVIAYRFYKNMFTDEGYLTFTLPVSIKDLLLSKTIIAFVWTILSTIIAILSIMILMLGYVQFGSLFQELGEFWNELMRAMDAYAPHSWLVATEVLLLIILSLIGWVLKIYASFAVGQLTGKHKILLAVGAYFGFGVVEQFLGTALLLALPYLDYTAISQMDAVVVGEIILLFGLLLQLVFTAAYGVITWILMKRKVNLQ